MAQRAIRTTLPDGRTALNNIIDKYTGESIQLVKIDALPDGVSADGIIYFETNTSQFGTEYWIRAEYLTSGVVDVKWFGARGDGVTDDTIAIQQAINSVQDYESVVFNKGTYMVSEEIIIPRSMKINSIGAKIIMTREEYLINLNSIFYVNTSLDFLEIKGFEADSIATGTNLRISFFANGTNNDWEASASIKKLIIKNNQLHHLRVFVCGKDTVPFIDNNEWITEDSKRNNASYLEIAKGMVADYADKRNGFGWIKNNTFDVNPIDSGNFDIIKVKGSSKGFIIEGNHLRNRNVNCQGEIDVFSGGDAIRIVNNVLYNVKITRKEGEGVYHTDNEGLINLDVIQGNYFEYSPEFTLHVNAVIECRGSFFSIVNNQFKVKNSSRAGDFYILNIRTEDWVYQGGLNTARPFGYIVSGNMVDMRESPNAIFINAASYDGDLELAGGAASVTGNVVAGGKKFSGTVNHLTSFMGNIWTKPDSLTENNSFLVGHNSIALGNLSENAFASINSSTNSNLATRTDVTHDTTIDGTVIDNKLTNRIKVRGGGDITDILYKEEGRRVTLIGISERANIVQSNLIRLKDSTDSFLTIRGVLELEFISGAWAEVSRSY